MADDAVERGGDYVAVDADAGDESSPLLSIKPVNASRGYFGSFPGSIKFLIWNEFCERFSFYGMKTILALYLVQHLRLSENESTELVHLFIVACYATPLLGAFISDCYLVLTLFFAFSPLVLTHTLLLISPAILTMLHKCPCDRAMLTSCISGCI